MQVERAKACAQADRAGRYLSLDNAMHLSNSPIKCDKAIILINVLTCTPFQTISPQNMEYKKKMFPINVSFALFWENSQHGIVFRSNG